MPALPPVNELVFSAVKDPNANCTDISNRDHHSFYAGLGFLTKGGFHCLHSLNQNEFCFG